MGKSVIHKGIALLMAVILCTGLCTGFSVNAQEVSGESVHSLKNPDIGIDLDANESYRTTWDCISFGSYPQAEIVESAADYAEVEACALKSGDIIEDAQLYNELAYKANEEWDENDDIELNGEKYHRMSFYDNQMQNPDADKQHYQWTTTYEHYHFFKYEPVKWRVLKAEGNQVLLLSDIVLDAQTYNKQEEVTWENSDVRTWLNGEFFNRAFTSGEQADVIETDTENNTADKVFLLSEEEASDKNLGFNPKGYLPCETRYSKSSTYAKAKGVKFGTEEPATGIGSWWIRTPAGKSVSRGQIVSMGGSIKLNIVGVGVRVSLNLTLSSDNYTYEGTVCSDGTESAPGSGDEGTGGDDGNVEIKLNNPKIEKNSAMEAGQKVTWDCVWFGSYPQAEVVPSKAAYTAVNSAVLRNEDIIEDSGLYDKLKSAPESEWNKINDITLDGGKYRRIKRTEGYTGTGGHGYYDWKDSEEYHYFKYEPIKWRVLKADGDRALLLADKGLDCMVYSYTSPVTWENSLVRSWLNGYGRTSNKDGMDCTGTQLYYRNFINSAFTGRELTAIEETSVVNADNIDSGTDGGNDTEDKIFFLSESEVSRNSAADYGFVPSVTIKDEGRFCKSSTYAKARGVFGSNMMNVKGNGFWWLRTPGSGPDRAAYVCYHGDVVNNSKEADDEHSGGAVNMICSVRPALNLKLSSGGYTSAGTISSEKQEDETGGGSGDNGNNGNNENNPGTSDTLKKPVKVSKITLSGISKQIAAGKKIKLTAKITPSNAANKGVTWKSSNKKVATVNSAGVVTIKKKTGGKSVTITATAKDGSKVKATYKIKSMKGVVKKVTISGKKSVKAGKTLKLKAKVTATKKANKKLKWTTSNKKYATVSSSGKVKALKKGKGKKVKITAMATDGSGKKKSVTIQIK